jgi:hypothetical protein
MGQVGLDDAPPGDRQPLISFERDLIGKAVATSIESGCRGIGKGLHYK